MAETFSEGAMTRLPALRRRAQIGDRVYIRHRLLKAARATPVCTESIKRRLLGAGRESRESDLIAIDWLLE